MLAVFFEPMFYTAVRSWFKDTERQKERFHEHALAAGMTADVVEKYVHDAEDGLSEQEREALHHAGEQSPTASSNHNQTHEG